MTYTYKPAGVCSRKIVVELEGETIQKVAFTDGCGGNASGISRLVRGMNARDVIAQLRGTTCGLKKTSCPDQLSIALEKALQEIQK